MNTTIIRDAGPRDAKIIVDMIRCMVADMASHGGHAPSTEDDAGKELMVTIVNDLEGADARYVIAESPGCEPVGVAGGQVVTFGGVFAPKKVMHVSVVYVSPKFRRCGIGSTLLARMLDWGRAAGCQACELNVLAENPAKSLYERQGFAAFEFKMMRPL